MTDGSASVPTIDQIADLATSAGLQRVNILAWRDLDDSTAGGSESHAASVSRVWAEAGLKVTMRTSAVSGAVELAHRDGYAVIRRGGRHTVFAQAAIAELTGRHGPRDALVEIWNGVPFLSPVWARGPRMVWLHYPHTEIWEHTLPRGWATACGVMERRLVPHLYRRTHVVTLGDSSRQRLINEFGLRPEMVHVVPPGIADRFRPSESQPRSATPLLVAVGRLTAYKRFHKVINAVHQLRTVYKNDPLASQTRLVIVGSGDDRSRLEHLIADLDAHAWCQLTGWVDDHALVGWYRRAWAVVSASISEGWGMTVTEAAACGTPAVASKIDGHTDSIVDGRTGHLVSDDDNDHNFVTALRKVTADPEHRDRLGAAALARASKLRWERTGFDTLSVLAQQRYRKRHRTLGVPQQDRNPNSKSKL